MLLVKMQGTGSYVHALYYHGVATDKVSAKYMAKVLDSFWEEAQSALRGSQRNNDLIYTGLLKNGTEWKRTSKFFHLW